MTLLLSTTSEELTHAREGLEGVEKELIEKFKANTLLTEDLTFAEEQNGALKLKIEELSGSTADAIDYIKNTKDNEIAHLRRKLDQTLAKIAQTNTELERISKEMDEISSKKIEFEEENEILKGQVKRLYEENEWVSETANAKLESLSQKNQSLQSLLEEARAQLAENNRRMSVELSDRGDVSIFEQGKATLTAEGRSRLYRLLPDLSRAVTVGRPNVLRVAGHASPERMVQGIRRGFDNNLQLSAERSLTIAYEFASLGVSLRCISIEGHGRSRSPTLKAIDEDQRLEGFDSQYRSLNAFNKRRFLRQVAVERRVEVLVTREADGQCSHHLLRSGVQAANQEASRRLNNR